MKEREETDLASRYPGLCASVPSRDEEAEGMTQAEGDAGEEGPLLALEPVVVLDVVRVGENGVEGEEWDSIQVGVPWQADMQGRPRNFGGNDLDRAPVLRQP